jgi:hypothetical protein
MSNDEMTGNGTSGVEASADPSDLTEWVASARRGLRRDVAELVHRLELGELFVPLAKPVPDAPLGEQLEIEDDLTITPHLIVDDEGLAYCVLFTRADILEPLSAELGWTTDGGPLEYCALPAKVGLDLALQVVDEEHVMALVLNAGHETELMLQRHEVGSLAKGQALPLVGYVQHIPMQDFEKTLIAETDEAPPAAFIQAIERCLGERDDIEGYELLNTFNADRDLEPHLTLSLKPKSIEIDFEQVTQELIEALGDDVPEPGYVDIVFDRTPKAS